MDLRKEDFPATIQAFELMDDREIFIAEQVVNSQPEIETFTSRYAGKLIKAKKVPETENGSYRVKNVTYKRSRSSIGVVMVIIVLILVMLAIYGFSTGWIQEKLNLNI